MPDARAKSRVFLTALAFVITAGRVRRDGRNADCKWPGETPLRAATPAHLSADAEFAEDLAIRYAECPSRPAYRRLRVRGSIRRRQGQMLGAHICVQWIWRRYSLGENGWLSGAIMAVATSFFVAAGSTLTGEVWAGLVETYRIGNGLISYRAGRLGARYTALRYSQPGWCCSGCWRGLPLNRAVDSRILN